MEEERKDTTEIRNQHGVAYDSDGHVNDWSVTSSGEAARIPPSASVSDLLEFKKSLPEQVQKR